MTFSDSQFVEMFPGLPQWIPAFRASCAEFEITTPVREAAFFANVHHESAGLTRLEESFAYNPVRLRAVFPKYFKRPQIAEEYVKLGPKAIASRVYALRMGNGSEASGDGWRYRGQGPMMLTGAANYIKVGAALDLPLWSKPELAKTLTVGARIAGYFWKTAGCNELADAGDFDGVADKINLGRRTEVHGDANGFSDRAEKWERFKAILGVPRKEAA